MLKHAELMNIRPSASRRERLLTACVVRRIGATWWPHLLMARSIRPCEDGGSRLRHVSRGTQESPHWLRTTDLDSDSDSASPTSFDSSIAATQDVSRTETTSDQKASRLYLLTVVTISPQLQRIMLPRQTRLRCIRIQKATNQCHQRERRDSGALAAGARRKNQEWSSVRFQPRIRSPLADSEVTTRRFIE